MRLSRIARSRFPGVFEAPHGEGASLAAELAEEAEEQQEAFEMALEAMDSMPPPGTLLRQIELEALGSVSPAVSRRRSEGNA